MKASQRFEIDSDGFAANQAYREPWTLVRELIANAFDEKITQCCVELKTAGPSQRGVWVTVVDDGPGFSNPSDIYTLYGPTPKKGDPKTRGRWNSGEKEFISIAREATVETTKCSVHFGKGRVVRRKGIAKGTRIRALLPWTTRDLSDTVRMLRRFIPTDNVEYTVAVIRGKQSETYRVPAPALVTTAKATLPTVLDNGEGLRPTKRKTTLKIYRPSDGEGWLYELGIPVQPIEAPYLVSIEQKVPLDPNRNMVAESYLKLVYAHVLNAVHDEIGPDRIGETWISEGVQRRESTPQARRHVAETKYPRTLLRSSDSRANEDALESGFALVDSRQIPGKERERLADFGLVPSGQIFKRQLVGYTTITEWTPGMEAAARFARWMAGTFLDVANLYVEFIEAPESTILADYGDRTLRFNLAALGGERFFRIPLSHEVVRLVLHEVCHEEGEGHDATFHKTVERVAAQTILRVASRPEEMGDLLQGA